MPSTILINKSGEAVQAFVSKYTNSNGDDKWFDLGANGGRDSWSREGWEAVGFKNKDDTRRAGIYVPKGAVVIFRSFDNITYE
jgi:hypothetical protein